MQMQANFRGQLLLSYSKYSGVSVLIYSHGVAVYVSLKDKLGFVGG